MPILELLRKVRLKTLSLVPTAKPNPTTRLEAWNGLVAQGRVSEAIALCLSEVPHPESDFWATSFLGYAYFQASNYQLAQKFLKTALNLSPGHYYSEIFLARTQYVLGEIKDSIELCTSCLRQHPLQADEILSFALPLTALIGDSTQTKELFKAAHGLMEQFSAITRAKLFFFGAQEEELAELLSREDQLKGISFRHIRSVKDWAANFSGHYNELGEPENIHFVNPDRNDRSLLSETIVQTNLPYLAEIPGAIINSGSSVIFFGDNLILSDLLTDKRYGRFASLEYDRTVIAQRPDALLINLYPTTATIPEGFMLSGLVSEAFGHWFAEFLPRLRHFERHPRYSEIPILVDEGMPDSHYDFLKALVDNPIIKLTKGTSVKVDRLHIAPTTTFFPTELFMHHTVPPQDQPSWSAPALKYIGDKIAARFSSPPKTAERIFLSRKNSKWRRIVNEDELLSHVIPLGFKTVFLENHSFEEQVRILQGAEFIIAPNGSALNNLIFAKPSTKVLVFGQFNHFNWGGWLGPMMDLGYKPIFLAGRPVGSDTHKHSDYSISTPEFRRVVDEIMRT